MNVKLSTLFIVSIFALLSTSVAYSLWSEEVTIWADIHTGTVEVEWNYDGYMIEQDNPDSWIDGYITYWDPFDPDNLNCLRLEIHDALPSVFYYVYFDIQCVGSIPVHFTDWEINTDLPYGCYQYDVYLDVIRNAGGQIIVDESIPIDEIQLHEGDTAFFVLWFHFEDCIEVQTTYIFDLHTMEYQFNEEPTG